MVRKDVGGAGAPLAPTLDPPLHDADWYIIFFVIIFAQLEDTSLSVYLLRNCKQQKLLAFIWQLVHVN